MSGEKEWRECVVKHQHGIWTVPLMCSYALPYTDQPIEMIDKRALDQLQREKNELVKLLRRYGCKLCVNAGCSCVVDQESELNRLLDKHEEE